MSQHTFEIETPLAADAHAVLTHASTLKGVNKELGPILRMTMPAELDGISLFEAPLGTHLFRSWLLLGGILPIDFDDIQLAEIDPESGFVEASTMWTISHWRHERRVRARVDGGSTIVDRLTFEPKIAGTGRILQAIVRAVFKHRHRRLQALFGNVTLDGGE